MTFTVPADACPPAEPNANPRGNRVIREVDDVGDLDGPTIVLTPRPALGATWGGSFDVVTRPTGDDAAVAISVDWQASVTECEGRGDRGGWTSERTISAISVDVDPEAKSVDRPIDQPEPLVGVTFETRYDDFGSIVLERIPLEELSAEYPDGAWYNLYLDIDRYFSWLVPTMPSDLVGVGATWEYSVDDEIRAPSTGIVYRFEVLAIEGTSYRLEFEIGGPGGLVGRGEVTGDITKPLPERAQLTGQLEESPASAITAVLTER